VRSYVLLGFESIEVFTKAQVSDQIKQGEIEPPNNVHSSVCRASDLLVELLDKQIKIRIHQWLLLPKSGLREGVV
jgi:hypothetical protein